MDIGAHPKTRATANDGVRLARDLYGLETRAFPLPSEYDDNFRLEAAGGTSRVLKIMHPLREPDFVDMQCSALARIAARDPGLPVPRVVPDAAGRPWSRAAIGDGPPRIVWMLSYLEGRPMAGVRPVTAGLLGEIGGALARLDLALEGFSHPAAGRELKWDLVRAGWIRERLCLLRDPRRRALVERTLARYDAEAAPALARLRRGVVYADANEHNVLVRVEPGRRPSLAGFIDFGDMVETVTVAETAVAAAYAAFGAADPLEPVRSLLAGYHRVRPLAADELAVLDILVRTRLAVSVVNSAVRAAAEPGDPYLTISEAPAWAALEAFDRVPPGLAHYAYRDACGLPPVPHGPAVVDWLRSSAGSFALVLDHDLRADPVAVLDLSVGSRLLGADPANLETPRLAETIARAMKDAGAAVGLGRYDEARPIYGAGAFAAGGHPAAERRTVHLGLDLSVPPGSAVRAPLDGVVRLVARNDAPKDYGPLVVLRHAVPSGPEFFTLYGHLDPDSVAGLEPGRALRAGERFAAVGAPPANGDWWPHVHIQIILDLLGLDEDFPGVAAPGRRSLWTGLSPDPNLLLGVPDGRFPRPEPDKSETLAARGRLVGPNLSVSYREPLKIVRGWMQYLYDEAGRAFLDAYNNVPLVGHSHPRVVRAVQEQMALLNTNTRYLHDNLVRYAGRLAALMPDPLRVCYVLNSASEANELALRLARARTGREDVIVLESAYHGHTTGLIDISPYKFAGPGGRGRRPWVHVAPLPDDYRGPFKREDPEAGRKYADAVARLLAEEVAPRGGPAAFIAETLPSVAGQIVLPAGYLAAAYRHVRSAGGVCIADEVQVGFGRLGTRFWGFETQEVVPDIVVLGKPIGNGFPLAAVVTTGEIAAAFDNGMEFFSTFGGNPVACAAGLAVLDVMAEERLQERALRVGRHFVAGLKRLADRHPIIGDVRGSGLFLGLELVRDRRTLEPAAPEASYVVDRLRERGILTGTDGPLHNVIKIRPPLCFSEADADLFIAVLDQVLAEDPVRIACG
ncbi:MAG TPA: aminotransferase class III-fold pyridoxal phosphate-dependent enzyme [Candidatus Aminicenantes bacterium]|nr:aminotransferase class III-fold pyridoxal phosphate-dependent enzyme [Candidatus Aminicenantes bacterium]HRY64731.1 aminotransferase class III-fold pyridoxal phosphate-dependent enzyme [Candidatus Aminicenantes bacterium]HRZ71644.1 aminotransferase class III-fold pyridoxal phosphate-dependent enzyme [Candidatus Aminicenantes bacterium]